MKKTRFAFILFLIMVLNFNQTFGSDQKKTEIRSGSESDGYLNISQHQSPADGYTNIKKDLNTNHNWILKSKGLVAHAGGGILNIEGTNCYEALITNYNNGHRVFELDFNLTSDNRLVAVHDWSGYRGPRTSKEYEKIKIADVFKSMDIDDVFEMMSKNKDMYLITDTKSFEYTKEETKLQFKLLYDASKKYSGNLMDRVIPQIYNQEMYSLIQEIYPFKSIIYTLYASKDTNQQVIDFIRDKNEIKVVCMAPVRFSEDFNEQLMAINKCIFLFTINEIETIDSYRKRSVQGFYTDFILPKQISKN